jgi:hypothetical protein
VPDHSTFSKNRHGRFHDSETLRFVFEQVLEQWVREGLVGGEGFAIDASLVKADANRQRGVPGAEAAWSDQRTHITQADTIIYRSSPADCANCPMKARCCPNTPTRKIARSVHEAARDVARALAKADAYKQSRNDRKKVEMRRFAASRVSDHQWNWDWPAALR